MTERIAYAFLISRPCDKGECWWAIYENRELAENAFGRVSDLIEVRADEPPRLAKRGAR